MLPDCAAATVGGLQSIKPDQTTIPYAGGQVQRLNDARILKVNGQVAP